MNLVFSVVICTRNRATTLRDTLNALAATTFADPWELIVVDNGSTDDTRTVVSSAIHSHGCTVRYLRELRPGKSFALNRAIDEAQGEHIAFTDDDALPAPDWMLALESAFVQGADWVFGPVEPRWASGRQPAWFCEELNGMFSLIDFGRESFAVSDPSMAFNGINCAARREALAFLGPFRTDLGPTSTLGGGGEDTEMFSRAFVANQQIVYVPEAVVEHVIPLSRMTRAFHRRRILSSRRQAYRLAVSTSWNGPRIGGVPRYYFGVAFEELTQLIRSAITGNRSLAFYHELRLLSFSSVFQQAVVNALKRTRTGEEAA